MAEEAAGSFPARRVQVRPIHSAVRRSPASACDSHPWQLGGGVEGFGGGGMSLEVSAKIICDNCCAFIEGRPSSRSTRCSESYWDAMGTAKKNGWITVSRGRYRKPAHYCQFCSDKPAPVIKDGPRRKRCRGCNGSGMIQEKVCEGWIKGKTCPECSGTGKPNP